MQNLKIMETTRRRRQTPRITGVDGALNYLRSFKLQDLQDVADPLMANGCFCVTLAMISIVGAENPRAG
jgi:hypothetical protein